MEKQHFDLVVIGGGPGGYVAAIRAAQQGRKTALVEAREMGGTCLNRGCIPSKTLIANADVLRTMRHASQYGIHVSEITFDYAEMKKRTDGVVDKMRRGLEGLIASNQITVFHGYGRLTSPYEVAVTGQQPAVLTADAIILATGSEPRPLPLLPFDSHRVLDSTSLLNLTKLPKKLIIIGGGVIGCEFACVYNALDVEVTIIELLPTLLPTEAKQIAETLTKILKRRGVVIETGAKLTRAEIKEERVVLTLEQGQVLEADKVLVSIGRQFNTQNVGLDAAGVLCEANGTLTVNAYMQTNVPHIYAIGDITGKWLLAHVASHQGMVAADHIAGKKVAMDYKAIPSVIFTDPEIASVGYTLEKAIEAGYKAVIGKFPFQALGKAQATLETEGFAQIVINEPTGEILGAQVVGKGASNLIAEMTVAIQNEIPVEELSHTIHAHPTFAEAWMEAALLAKGMPLHLPPRSLTRG